MRNGLRTWVLWALLSGAAAASAWIWVEAGPPVTSALSLETDGAMATLAEADAGLRWLALIAAGVVAVGYIGVRRPDR